MSYKLPSASHFYGLGLEYIRGTHHQQPSHAQNVLLLKFDKMFFPLTSYSDFWGFPTLFDAYPLSSRLRVHDTHHSGSRTVCPTYSYRKQDGTAYLELEVPGVEKCDISVETKGRKLVVIAKRYSEEKDKEGKKKLHVAYRFDARLSEKTDISGIKADYRGLGILRLFIPLKGEEVRKISIDS